MCIWRVVVAIYTHCCFFATLHMRFSRGIGGRTGGQPINQKLKFLRQIFFGCVDPVL